MPKYIKGKDGKFKGSIPDAPKFNSHLNTLPTAPAATGTPASEDSSSISAMYALFTQSSVPTYTRENAISDLTSEGFTVEELENDPTIIQKRLAQQELATSIEGTVPLTPPGSQKDQYELGEDGRPKTVYYASYGSNLFADRFGVYIGGGSPEGSTKEYTGCRDKSEPTDDIPVLLNGTIHYAGNSKVWDGGVAFLDTEREGKALGRAYRITAEQFDDVVAQECQMDVGTKTIDMQNVIENGKLVEPGIYGSLAHVGDYNGAPVFTFTGDFSTSKAKSGEYIVNPQNVVVHKDDPSAAPVEGQSDPWPIFSNPPSAAYVKQISSGLKETHGLTDEQARIYFAGSTGLL